METKKTACFGLVLLLAGLCVGLEYGIDVRIEPTEMVKGDMVEIKATIINNGTDELRQVRAVLESAGDNLELTNIEESLGTIESGKNKTAVFTAKVLNTTETEIRIKVLIPGEETKEYIYRFPFKEFIGVN